MNIKLNFKKSLIAFSTILVGLAVAISNAISYNETERLLIDRIHQQMETALITQADNFEQKINDLSQGVTELAQLVENRTDDQGLGDMVTVSAKLMNADSVMVGFDDNSAYGSHWPNNKPPASYKISERPWFKSATQSNQVVISAPFHSATRNKMVFSIAKRFSGGVVVVTMDVQLLKEMVNQAAAVVTFAILMEKNGTAIYSNNPVVVPGENTKDFAPPMYQAVMKRQDLFEFTQTYANEVELVTMKQLKVGDTNWYLANGALERKFYAQLSPVRNNAILTTVIAIVVAISVMLLLLRVLYQPLLQLRDTLAELAKGKGDLTQRMTVVNDKDDLGIITHHINSWIENNQQMMLDIYELSENLGNVIEEINITASANLAVLSEHVNQTEMVVSAIEELNTTSKNVAQNALDASTLAESANVTGQDSKEVVMHAQQNVMALVGDVRDTADNVKTMSNKTENISSMTEVIGNIADQTNLLALNAAIEAARAGEHGRGFAVVADEVRNLASRTQSNTVEIDDAVSGLLTSSSEIVSKMEMTSQAGETAAEQAAMVTESLSSLTDSISNMNDITSQIATAADEQTRVTDEVSKNIFEMSDMANQVNNNVKQSAKNVETMAAMYSQLSAMVGAFKIS